MKAIWSTLISLFVVCLALPIFMAYTRYLTSVYLVMLASALVLGSVTGIAFAYNVSFAIFGGLTPVIAMSLIHSTGNLISPSWYLIASDLAGLLGCWLLYCSRSTAKKSDAQISKYNR